MIFFIYARTFNVCIFTITLCHDFTFNLSRKSREINCVLASNIRLAGWFIYKYTDKSVIRIVKMIDI